MTDKIGPTGRFPQGKMSPADDGELAFGVARDSQGNVHINFGKPVSWLAMPPELAIEMAKMLLRHAGATKVEIEFGSKP